MVPGQNANVADRPIGPGCGGRRLPVSVRPSDVVTMENAGTVGRYHPDARRRWFGIASTGGIAMLLGIIFLIATSSVRYVEPASSTSLTTFDVHIPDQQPIRQSAPIPAQPPALPQMEFAEEKRAPIPAIATATTPRAVVVPQQQQQPLPPSPPPPVSATPSVPPVPQAQAEMEGPDSWEGRVLAKLIAHRRYPRAALLRRFQGTPIIRLVIDRDGVVRSVRLEKSSRIPDLDREALALPRRAQPLPKPPESKEGTSFEFVVPIEFSLSP